MAKADSKLPNYNLNSDNQKLRLGGAKAEIYEGCHAVALAKADSKLPNYNLNSDNQKLRLGGAKAEIYEGGLQTRRHIKSHFHAKKQPPTLHI